MNKEQLIALRTEAIGRRSLPETIAKGNNWDEAEQQKQQYAYRDKERNLCRKPFSEWRKEVEDREDAEIARLDALIGECK